MNNKCYYKLLVVGNAYDNHIVRYVENLRKVNDKCIIDIITKKMGDSICQSLFESVNNIFEFSSKKVGFLRHIKNIVGFRRFVEQKLVGKKYDVVVIQYVFGDYLFILPILRKCARILISCPWGSDILRTGAIEHFAQHIIFKNSDFIVCGDTRFGKYVQSRYAIPKNKICKYGLAGSAFVDLLLEKNNKISSLDAKTFMGISANSYVITCAYNSSPAQNHSIILKSLGKIEDLLPQNLVLLFPFTYGGGDEDYKQTIKTLASSLNFHSIFIESYLSEEDLFYLRKCSDMFIHIQNTDANNASLKEYLYCGVKVINGSWLEYDDLTCYEPLPYWEVTSFDDLPNTILQAYNDKPKNLPQEWCDNFRSFGAHYRANKLNEFYSECVEK